MNKIVRVSLGLMLVILITACLWVGVRQENPKCDFDSLFLDVEEMPVGWEVKWVVLPPALDRLGAQQAQEFFMENGLNTASHTIYRYSNRWLAVFRDGRA